MSNHLNRLIIFAAGLVIGAMTAYKYAEKKYEKIAQEEIDSVKEVFSKKKDSEDKKREEPEAEPEEKISLREYADIAWKEGYMDYSNANANSKNEEREVMDKPYIIPPEEFGTLDEYETISLTYYADEVLTDDNDDVMEDTENIIGSDALNRFGEFEEDSVFVRNDVLKCDYEILLDQRAYYDEGKSE